MTIAKATTDYISKGGTVTVLPGFLEIKPLPAAKHPQRSTEDTKDYSDWYSSRDIREIVGIPDSQHYKISNAIDKVYSEDGVIILVDMGSAVMTTEMVIESMTDKKIKIADCPLVEGAVTGSIDSISGLSINEILIY